jgi:hypothetical protein
LPSAIDINEDNSTIRVFDWQNDKYITYSMEGLFIDEGALSKKGIDLPRIIADDYMVVRGSPESTHLYYITDRDMNIRQGLFPIDTNGLTRFERMGLTQLVGIGSNGNGALVNPVREDTLYRVTGQGMTPEAILKKGQYRLPPKPIFPIFDRFDSNVFTFLLQSNVTALGEYYIIDQWMDSGRAAQLWSKSDGQLVAYSDSRNGFSNFGLKMIVTLPSGGIVTANASSFLIENDMLAFTLNAIDAVEGIKGVKEDDNPVIVIAKLKK